MVDPAPRVRTAAQVADHAAILHDHVIEAIDRTEATSLFDPLSLLERLVAQVEDLAAVVAGERPNLPADMSCCCSTNPGECPVHEPAEVEGLVRPVPTCRWCQQPIHLTPDDGWANSEGRTRCASVPMGHFPRAGEMTVTAGELATWLESLDPGMPVLIEVLGDEEPIRNVSVTRILPEDQGGPVIVLTAVDDFDSRQW
jgi:hypothetical protein